MGLNLKEVIIMTDLEKIQLFENKENEVKEKTKELDSRKAAFQAYISSLTKEYESSQKELLEELNSLKTESGNLAKTTVTVNLSNLLHEISKEYNLDYRIKLSVWMIRSNNYLNEGAIIESIDENEELKSLLSIYFPSINESIDIMYLSTYLLKNNHMHKHESKLKIFCTNDKKLFYSDIFWTFDLNYDLNNVILNIPINVMLKENDPRLKNALFNCVKNKEKSNNVPKTLLKKDS